MTDNELLDLIRQTNDQEKMGNTEIIDCDELFLKPTQTTFQKNTSPFKDPSHITEGTENNNNE